MHWGTPVMESGITLIDDGRLYYRGATSWISRDGRASRKSLPSSGRASGDGPGSLPARGEAAFRRIRTVLGR